MKKVLLVIFLILGYLGASSATSGGPIKVSNNSQGIEITGNNKVETGSSILATLSSTTIDIKGDFWLTMMTIWCTLFAVFFVYEGFRIEKVSSEMSSKHDSFMKSYEEEINYASFYTQINYCLMRFNVNKYQKGIDYLADMIKVENDENKTYMLSTLIGQGYYNRGKTESDILKKKEYFSSGLVAFERAKTIYPFKFEDQNTINELSDFLLTNP